jgi:hypothetical protein
LGFFYEMLIEIGMDAIDCVALLIGPRLWTDIGIRGANCIGVIFSGIWQHFLHMRAPTRNIANAIRIMAAGEVKAQ